jgi:hypothetical protein
MNPHLPTPNFDDILFRVTEETFGELAFMLAVPEEIQPIDRAKPQWGYAARVDFTGPFGGRLYVAVTDDMLHPLSANMLGIDPDEPAPEGVQLEDGLKELLNVICGNLLPVIAGDEVVFNIGGPVLLETPHWPADLPGHLAAGKAQLTLDCGEAFLELFVDENAQIPAAQG